MLLPRQGRALQSRGLRQIDPEPVSAALVTAGHFGRGMAELFLHMALVDLCRGGEAGAQRMAGEFLRPFALGEIAAYTGGERGTLDQPGDLLVVQPLRADLPALAADATEDGPLNDFSEFYPGFDRIDRAGI